MSTRQPKIAVLAGGFSSEREISLASGQTAFDAFINAGMEAFIVDVRQDGWYVDGVKTSIENLGADYCYNAVHGTPGENGLISGALEMLGIPHSTCDTFESALTFNKGKCNELLALYGIAVPKGKLYLTRPPVEEFKDWNFPLFIKPNRSGSSFGITRVSTLEEVDKALDFAFKEDDQIIVEEEVVGTEMGCGVLSSRTNFSSGTVEDTRNPQAIALTEIVPTEAAFFDYQAKYEGKSQEITPARISEEVREEIFELSKRVYQLLSLKGIVRIDYIWSAERGPVLIEVNSIPGLSPASIVPQQIAYRNWDISKVFSTLAIEDMQDHD